MGLGREKKSDDQVSLLDVSARRFHYYLWTVEAVVIWMTVLSVVGTVRQGKGWCLESLVYFLRTMAEYLNGPVSAVILACGAIEGFIVGLTKALLRQSRRQARAEGIQEGIQEGIEIERERLRRAGVEIPSDPGQQGWPVKGSRAQKEGDRDER